MGRIFCAVEAFVVAGTDVAEVRTGKGNVVVIGVVVPFGATSFRSSIQASCMVGKGAGGGAVNKGGAKFAWSRGEFIGKCGEDIGSFLGVTFLVVLVV